jgi:DNA polymerase-1
MLGTETGRWASYKPFAIQTIPRDKVIKKLVIPEDGYVLISCDYSQAELRILAFYSGDEWLRQAAINNEDLHVYSASFFFDKTVEEIKAELNHSNPQIRKEAKEKRHIAKSGNFLCVYRGSAYALHKLLGIPLKEAQKLQEKFFSKAVKVMKWSDSIIEFMRKNKYVVSCYGRIRRFPLYNYYNDIDKEKAEKESANSVIQGTSADFCNYSILETLQELAKAGFSKPNKRVKVIAQIHDSVLFEVPEDWVDLCKIIIKSSMETPKYPVDIPMLVEMKTGESYGDLR